MSANCCRLFHEWLVVGAAVLILPMHMFPLANFGSSICLHPSASDGNEQMQMECATSARKDQDYHSMIPQTTLLALPRTTLERQQRLSGYLPHHLSALLPGALVRIHPSVTFQGHPTVVLTRAPCCQAQAENHLEACCVHLKACCVLLKATPQTLPKGLHAVSVD